jgi:CubicO group peptidase (beta-lactamase class C family)
MIEEGLPFVSSEVETPGALCLDFARHEGAGTWRRRELLRLGGAGALAALLGPSLAFAQTAPAALANLTAFLDKWVGPGKFPGIVTALGLPGQPTQYLVRGSEGFTDADPVSPDSLFRIYSMTKPVTGMAAMLLIEDGRLGLDQPLADILPRYARMQVQVTPDGSITDLRPARTPITIRHLLTHTAGLGYTIIQRGPLKKAMEEAGLVAGQISRTPVPGLERGKPVPSLALFADRMADMPLVHEPGTQWLYSVSLDVLGRVIEVVSGQPFDQFLRRRLFEPCGMTSTWFQVPRTEAGRLTTNYGALGTNLFPIDKGEDSIFLDKPAFPFGGSGLVSSPRDYDRFLTMLANYGRIGRERVMGELAVRVGTGNLLPEGMTTPAMMGPPGHFGAGGRVGIGAEAGIFGWAGAAGTVGAVDMRHGVRSGIYVQFMPPNANPVLSEYQRALQADIQSLRPRS